MQHKLLLALALLWLASFPAAAQVSAQEEETGTLEFSEEEEEIITHELDTEAEAEEASTETEEAAEETDAEEIPTAAETPAVEAAEVIPTAAETPAVEAAEEIPTAAETPAVEAAEEIPTAADAPVVEAAQEIPAEAQLPVEEAAQEIPTEAPLPVEEAAEEIPTDAPLPAEPLFEDTTGQAVSPQLEPPADWPTAETGLQEASTEAVTLTAQPDEARSADLADLGDFVIGVHIGPSLSVFSDLDPHVMPRFEFGYNLPVWGRRLEPHLTVAYTPPRASGTVDDTRLPQSGEFSWEIKQDELTLGLGILARFLELGRFVNGYAAIGPQVVFLHTSVVGEAAGEPFGENSEEDVKFGIYGALGIELVLGPGAAFFQLGIAWSDLDGRITGDSNTGNLSPALGYRLML
ncbi:MAG: hypothetical protein JW797_08675 [Bradymonadales bacterium]|nr:hypothetical protein [Bradymonadales bacterium]